MVIYKEHHFLPFMPEVEKYSRGLDSLNDQWENAKLLCEINCPEQAANILPSMTKIQNNFSALQKDLISTLISETINKMEQKTKFKAQVAVDILIRNLYERTADVGFLATDGDIEKFASKGDTNEQDRIKIEKRLHDYVAKYTVYEEIIILDKNFTVIANLDKNNPILGKRIDDELLRNTLETKSDFLESYGYSPLQSGKKKAHIFSKKIMNEAGDKVTGIICLCFRIGNEMHGIFEKLSTDYDGSVITILDEQNTVIASSDSNHVPVGIKAEPVPEDENGIVYYRGIEYIAKTVPAKGYQGYFGLGWKGHIMIPLRLAFKEKSTDVLKSIDKDIMSGLMVQADSFSVKLNKIMGNTQKINKSLKRIVYNGQILAKNGDMNEEYKRLKPLLSNINKTGVAIKGIFEKSVRNLFATVISTALRENRVLASHCIDVMDRNLYERADDCRWWALNPTFKSVLSHDEITESDKLRLAKILQYINSLYTVYSNLFLFDKKGKIVAVSNQKYKSFVGKILDEGYIKEIIQNRSQDKYFVSPFAANEMYDSRCTYVYGASVTSDNQNGKTVGGIGIIFDSEFQFKSMLDEVMTSKDNSFAVFCEKSGKIISSSGKDLPAGSSLKIPARFFALQNSASYSEIIIYDGSYYAVGCACSSGYREYKNSDGYKNDVIALLFEKLADCAREDDLASKSEYLEQSEIPYVSGKTKTLASFILDGRLLALDQSVVVEAVEGVHVTTLPESSDAVMGIIQYHKKYVTVLDTHRLFGLATKEDDNYNLLIIKLGEDTLAALIVDQLNNVIEVSENFIKQTPKINGSASVVKEVVCFNKDNSKFVLILDEKKLMAHFDPKVLKLDIAKLMPILKKQAALEAAKDEAAASLTEHEEK